MKQMVIKPIKHRTIIQFYSGESVNVWVVNTQSMDGIKGEVKNRVIQG